MASSGQPDPEARAGAGAATGSEDKVESDLKGYVSIVFLPAPLVLAPTLLHLERFDGWMLGAGDGSVIASL